MKTLAMIVSLVAVPAAALAATLKADYQFQGDFTSEIVPAPDLVQLPEGTGGFAAETVDGQTRSVYTFTGGAGLLAQTNGLISPSAYSVVFYARLDLVPNTISKIIDFKNLTSDAGLYTVANIPTFYDATLPVGFSLTGFPATGYAQLAFTRDAGDMVNVYLDGAPIFSFSDPGGLAVIDDPASSSEFLNLFVNDDRDTLVTSGLDIEQPAGAVARLRLYDGALTPAEVAELDIIPEPATLTLMGAVLILLSNRPNRRRRTLTA